MSAIGRFLKTTLIGGILFLIPLVVVWSVVRQAVGYAAAVVRPIAKLFPTERFAGLLVVDLLAIAAVIGLCFLLGLLIATPPGRALSQNFERRILTRVPGYLFLKSLTHGMSGFESGAQFVPALIRLDDMSMLGFVVERDPDGLVTVFVPSAPTPAVGSLYYVTPDRVQTLRVSPMSAISSIVGLGVGSNALLKQARLAEGEVGKDKRTR